MARKFYTKTESDKIAVKAYDVASSYDLNGARNEFLTNSSFKLKTHNPLLIQFESKKTIAVFDYGSVVYFNFDSVESREFIERLRPFAERPNSEVSEDDFTLTISPETKDPSGKDELFIKEFNRDIALVVGTVLSRSVSLEYYEHLVADALAQLEKPISALQSTGKIPSKELELTKRVGFALAVEQELAHTLLVFDDPDIVWDGGKRIEELYINLKRQFDLDDRIDAIQQKVSIISRSSTFVISRLEAQRSRSLEWIIIVLIVLEIVLFVFGKI